MIVADSLSFSAGKQRILSSISLSIPQGQFICLIGPNGSGKSTLLRCLAGILTLSSGSVLLHQQNINAYSRQALAFKRAFMPQSISISFPFKTFDFVLMGRFPYFSHYPQEQDRKITRQALERLEITHLSEKPITLLSGGEKQRVLLAKAFVQIWQKENTCLFLDEPTSALDPKCRRLILNICKDMVKQNGLTLVAIMHEMNLVASYADQIVAIKEGGLFKIGTSWEIMSPPHISELFETEIGVMSNPDTLLPLTFLKI